jgi:hypothetical protein
MTVSLIAFRRNLCLPTAPAHAQARGSARPVCPFAVAQLQFITVLSGVYAHAEHLRGSRLSHLSSTRTGMFSTAVSARQDLRIGFFLWWLSFLLVALGLFDLSRHEEGKRSCENLPERLKAEVQCLLSRVIQKVESSTRTFPLRRAQQGQVRSASAPNLGRNLPGPKC